MPPKRQEVTSQATPLAQDILKLLQGQLSEGAFGTGVGPLQREAGTASRQFVESGGGQFDLSPLFKALEEGQGRRTEKAVGNLREGFGITGQRFGSALATGEAELRTGMGTNLEARMADITRQEFGAQQNRLLQGISQMFWIGQGNIQPFMQLAAMGINPDVFTENPWMTGLKAVGGAASGAAAIKGA